MTTFATIHEYRSVSDRVAKITASITGSQDADSMLDAIAASMNHKATPIRSSFRWLNESKSSIIGYVYAAAETIFLPDGKVSAGYRKVTASNLYMHAADESLWEMKEGAGGKYLARQGTDDLSSTLESARVSPRGPQPRMAQVLQASVKKHELVAFVNEGKRAAEVDYGICLSSAKDGSMTVLSHLTSNTMTIKDDVVIAAYVIDTKQLPKIPARTVARIVKASGTESLSSEQYWRALYGNFGDFGNGDGSPSEYLNKVLDQVREMSAA